MSDQKTTVKVGYEVDTKDLVKADEKVSRLAQAFKRLADYVATSAVKFDQAKANLSKMPTSVGGISRAALALRTQGELRVPGRKGGTEVLPVRTVRGLVAQSAMATGLGFSGRIGGIARSSFSTGAGAMGLGSMGLLGGAGLIAGAIGILGMGLANSKEYMVSLDALTKKFHQTRGEQSAFGEAIRENAHDLGMARKALLEYTKSYTGLAGAVQGADRIQTQVYTAGTFARVSGLNTGQTIQQYGQMAQQGVFGARATDGMRARDFTMLLADAISRGGMKGREGELIQSVQSLVGVQTQMLTRPQNVAGMMGMLTTMNQSGIPGLTGTQGAQLLAQVASGIRNPGGGAFGEYYTFRAMGGGDYYKFKYRQEEGIFGQNQNNLITMMNQYRKDFKDGMSRYFAMSRHLGITMHQAEALDKTLAKMGGQGGMNLFAQLKNALGAEKVERIAPEKFPFLADIANARNAEGIAKVLKDPRLNMGDEQISRILSSKDVRSTALGEVAKASVVRTDAERTQTSLNDLKEKVTPITDNLLPTVISLLEGINKGINLISSAITSISGVVKSIGKRFGSGTEESPEHKVLVEQTEAAWEIERSSPITRNMQVMIPSRNPFLDQVLTPNFQKSKKQVESEMLNDFIANTNIYLNIDGLVEKHISETARSGNGTASKRMGIGMHSLRGVRY
jgi:hypothetical protein